MVVCVLDSSSRDDKLLTLVIGKDRQHRAFTGRSVFLTETITDDGIVSARRFENFTITVRQTADPLSSRDC